MLLFARLIPLLILAAPWFDAVLGIIPLGDTSLGLVSRRNQTRKQAAAAYRAGQYGEALTRYQFLVRSSAVPSLGERVNLGHAYFRLGQYRAAKQQYAQAGADVTPPLRSVAATQLGVLACLEKDTAAALSQFRQALLSNPENTVARQNFELLTFRFSGRKPVRKAAVPVPKPRPTPQGQRAERTQQQRDQLTRTRNTTLSDEQARQVLDALQADDLPYALARRRMARQAPAKPAGRW